MKFANDRYGNSIHHSKGIDGVYYNCPNCLERVYIRRGLKACFYHEPIHDRTPLQRTCPEYHENEWLKKISNLVDKIYINNGGIPMYLCNKDDRFELRAYFPQVSEDSIRKSKQMNAKLYVNTETTSKMDTKIYNIDNLNFYTVNMIQKWIYVKCVPCINAEDINRKWLWGIRGIDIEKDIYHANKDGGYRVALKANVYVGKTYRIMFINNAPKINGIEFKKIGEIPLKEDYRIKNYNIYAMCINTYTEQSREFIEGKSYKLREHSNEMLPLWPPAKFTGNELIFNENRAFFLYINNTKKGKIYYTQKDSLSDIQIANSNNLSVVSIDLNEDKLIIISQDSKQNSISEIKYNILKHTLLQERPILKQVLSMNYTDGKTIDLINNDDIIAPKDGKLTIKSNVPFHATISNENYIFYSSSTYLENVNDLWKITINSRGFGIKEFIYNRKKGQCEVDSDINWEEEYLRLYRCTPPTIKVSNENLKLLYLLSKKINKKNIEFYRLFEKWVKTNSIPISALKYVDKIYERLGG